MAYHFNITDMTGNTEQDHIDASLTWFCAWTLGFIKVDNHTAHDFPLCGFDPAVMQYINFLLSKFKTFPWKPHLNIWLILSLQFHVCFKIWFADSCRFLCDQCSPPLLFTIEICELWTFLFCSFCEPWKWSIVMTTLT